MKISINKSATTVLALVFFLYVPCRGNAQDLGQLIKTIGSNVVKDLTSKKNENEQNKSSVTPSANASNLGASLSQYQSASGPSQIANFEIAGIKLGMSEEQAKAALRQVYPSNYKNFRGEIESLSFEKYVLQNPNGGANVPAGFFANLTTKHDRQTGFNYVWVATYQNKVWGVWRYELSATYDYERSVQSFIEKYPETDQRRVSGYLYELRRSEGKCLFTLPMQKVNDSFYIELQDHFVGRDCHKMFSYHFDVDEKLGVKSFMKPDAQMVDLDVGRQFFEFMKNSATNDELDRQKKRESAHF